MRNPTKKPLAKVAPVAPVAGETPTTTTIARVDSVPVTTHELRRAELDALARQLSPMGLASLPAMLTIALGGDEVPPELAMLGALLADASGEPIVIDVNVNAGALRAVHRVTIR